MNPDTPPLIELDPLTIQLGGQAIVDVGPWALRAGERWWVQGPNGCGKSSFLRLIAGQLWPASGQHTYRRFSFDDTVTWSPMAAKQRMVLLNPERQNRYLHQDWDLTAAEVIGTGFLDTDILHETLTPDEYTILCSVMDQLGIIALHDRLFLELSQGERRKVLIARALVRDPDVLLLDEFAEGLDTSAQQELWYQLSELSERGKAIVLTTHRPTALGLDGWRTLRIGATMRPQERQARAATEMVMEPPPTSAPLVEVRGDLYLEGKLLAEKIDWQVYEGEHVALLGANGCGKTSLLRLLWGELHLALGGEVVHFQDPKLIITDIREHVSLFVPDMHGWFEPHVLVEDVILSGCFSTIGLIDRPTADHRATVRGIAKAFGIEDFLERAMGTLSYGQTRKVLLARAMVREPRLLLLDEPFDGLDPDAHEILAEQLLQSVSEVGSTIVLTTHHESDIPEWVVKRATVQDRCLLV